MLVQSQQDEAVSTVPEVLPTHPSLRVDGWPTDSRSNKEVDTETQDFRRSIVDIPEFDLWRF